MNLRQLLVLGLAALAFGIVGCSGGDSNEPVPESKPATTGEGASGTGQAGAAPPNSGALPPPPK